MVEVSEIGLEQEEEEEIELDLGLSIGGSFRKSSEKMKPDSKCNGFDSDLGDNHHPQQQQVTEDVQRESTVGVGMDPQAKREIHALRRQEAKRKRQQKRWVRESEPEDQRVFKREKMDPRATTVVSTTPFPAPYLPVQYVPFNNGFVFPCGVPCWTQTASDKNVSQPPATECRGFRPFLANGCELEQNGERDCVNGSSMYTSFLVSDQQSSSHEGGTSTDSHSHSAHSLAEPTHLNSSNKENNIRSRPEQSASSHPVRSEHSNVEGRNRIMKEIQPKITAQPEPAKLKEEATMNSKAVPIDNPLSKETSSNGPLTKETKTDMGKPPKPVSQISSLPQMPYVSTTGNGPNGKTVNGFLYRYTKTEVSIVCVCHGSTFSPAEFVQHAGGTDVSHPLRHITVIPSAFG